MAAFGPAIQLPERITTATSVALLISRLLPFGNNHHMTWKTVRLELASTEEYPRGSAGRAFLLHVPIDSDGSIDRTAIHQHPNRATVRRFWASEPDAFGFIEPKDGGWALRCAMGAGEKSTFLLEAVPLRPNGQVRVQQPGQAPMPFRIASVRADGQPS